MQPARDIMAINKPFEIKEKLYMKATVFYFSVSGTTKRFAEIIADAMSAEGVEARAMSIEAVDEQWVKESRCVILGTPTYFADMAGTVKCFLEKCGSYEMSGKLAGAFATARYVHGGGEAAIDDSDSFHVLWHAGVFRRQPGWADYPSWAGGYPGAGG